MARIWRKRAKRWGEEGRSHEVNRHIIRRMLTFRGVVKYDHRYESAKTILWPFLKDNKDNWVVKMNVRKFYKDINYM